MRNINIGRFRNRYRKSRKMQMNTKRTWTILFIGGASGTGKSSVAYALGRFYQVNVMEVDDIYQAIKAITTKESLPATHFWSNGINWMEYGVDGNVNWLIDVSKEMNPALQAIVNNHLESGEPIIIEGDFIHPEFVATFSDQKIKAIYIQEPDKDQLLHNYYEREGGELQHFEQRSAQSIQDGKKNFVLNWPFR